MEKRLKGNHDGLSVMLFLIPILIVFFLCSVGVAVAKEKTYTLTLQSAFPLSDPSVGALKYLVEEAAQRSNGRLKIKFYGDGEIVPGDQLLDAVNAGVVDMMHSVGAFVSGVMPLGDVEFGLPMAYNVSWEDSYEGKANALRKLLLEKGLIELCRSEYAKHGHYYLNAFTTGPTVLLATKPMNNINDFKGKKIRVDGLQTAYYNTAGAKGTGIPGTEAYMALRLGTVDAAEWDVGAITGMSWYEVAPYWITGMETNLLANVTIQKKKWDSLPEDIQKALADSVDAYCWKHILNVYKGEFDKAEALVESGKLTKIVLDKDSTSQFSKNAELLWDELAKKDVPSEKAIAIIKEWIATNQK